MKNLPNATFHNNVTISLTCYEQVRMNVMFCWQMHCFEYCTF